MGNNQSSPAVVPSSNLISNDNHNNSSNTNNTFSDTASHSSTGTANETRQQSRVANKSLLQSGEAPLNEDDISFLPIVSHFSYAVMCEWVYGEAERRALPSGWSLLLDATDCHLDREGYYAAAFINDSLRSVVVAQRGTTNAEGLRAGVWIFFDETSIQFHLAAQFSKLVRLRLQLRNPGCLPEDDAPGQDPGQIYTVSYTGHSLGAVLAACRAVEEHTFAVTFESPGCKKFVAQTMHPFKADDIDIITYLRNPNPVNSLKPHVGFLVQLPSEADDPRRITNMKKAASPDFTLQQPQQQQHNNNNNKVQNQGGVTGLSTARINSSSSTVSNSSQQQQRLVSSTANASTTSSTKRRPPLPPSQQQAAARKRPFGMPNLSLWSTQDFLRVRLLEAALPDVQMYLSRLEPALRELMDYTAQAHSISSIVNVMERGERTHQGQQVILRWPENLLQFVEYYNIVRELNLIWDSTDADARSKLTHSLSAYKSLLQKLWQTEFKPHFRIPLGFLNVHSRTLLKVLGAEDVDFQIAKLNLSKQDRRVLSTVYTESDNMVSTQLSAFQMKQYLAVVTQRAGIRSALERYSAQLTNARSKL